MACGGRLSCRRPTRSRVWRYGQPWGRMGRSTLEQMGGSRVWSLARMDAGAAGWSPRCLTSRPRHRRTSSVSWPMWGTTGCGMDGVGRCVSGVRGLRCVSRGNSTSWRTFSRFAGRVMRVHRRPVRSGGWRPRACAWSPIRPTLGSTIRWSRRSPSMRTICSSVRLAAGCGYSMVSGCCRLRAMRCSRRRRASMPCARRATVFLRPRWIAWASCFSTGRGAWSRWLTVRRTPD